MGSFRVVNYWGAKLNEIISSVVGDVDVATSRWVQPHREAPEEQV